MLTIMSPPKNSFRKSVAEHRPEPGPSEHCNVQGVKDVLDASDFHNKTLFLPTFIDQSTSKYSIGLEVLRRIPGGEVVAELCDCQTGTLVVCRHHTPQDQSTDYCSVQRTAWFDRVNICE